MSLSDEVIEIGNEIRRRVQDDELPTLVLKDIFLARYNSKPKIFHALIQRGLTSQEAMQVTGRATDTPLTDMSIEQANEAVFKVIRSQK